MKPWNWQKTQEVLGTIAFLAIFVFFLLVHSLSENHIKSRVTSVKHVERMIVVEVENGASFMIDAEHQAEPVQTGELYKFFYRNGLLYPRAALRIERCSGTEKK